MLQNERATCTHHGDLSVLPFEGFSHPLEQVSVVQVLVLLQTSDAKGTCYVETKGLDGETNLKVKKVQKDINEKLTEEQHVHQINGAIHCE